MNHLMHAKPCLMGKMTKTPFSETMERATDLLEIIHTDVCGPMSVDAKRCKVDNDSATSLWHCRLDHIGVKRMKKLHADGLLE